MIVVTVNGLPDDTPQHVLLAIQALGQSPPLPPPPRPEVWVPYVSSVAPRWRPFVSELFALPEGWTPPGGWPL